MWFDARAALAEIQSEVCPRAIRAIHAIPEASNSTCSTNNTPPVVHPGIKNRRAASMNTTATTLGSDDPAYFVDRFEELAAILEYDEGVSRGEAEACARWILEGPRWKFTA